MYLCLFLSMSIAYARGKIYALLRNQTIRMAGNADLHVVCAGGFGRLLFFALKLWYHAIREGMRKGRVQVRDER